MMWTVRNMSCKCCMTHAGVLKTDIQGLVNRSFLTVPILAFLSTDLQRSNLLIQSALQISRAMTSLPVVEPKYSTTEKMLAAKWYGKEDIRVEQTQKPLVTEAVSYLSYVNTISRIMRADSDARALKTEGYKLQAHLVYMQTTIFSPVFDQ